MIKFILKMLLVIQFELIMKRLNGDWEPNWQPTQLAEGQKKYFISYSNFEKKFIVHWSTTITTSLFYFKSKEAANAALLQFGDKKLGKLLGTVPLR